MDITAFVEPDITRGHIWRPLIAGNMLKFHIRKFFGNLDRMIHIAKRCCENNVISLFCQFADNPRRVRTFRHIFNKGCLNLIAKMLFNLLATNLMSIGPAMITRCCQIDKANLDLIGCIRRGHCCQTNQSRKGQAGNSNNCTK